MRRSHTAPYPGRGARPHQHHRAHHRAAPDRRRDPAGGRRTPTPSRRSSASSSTYGEHQLRQRRRESGSAVPQFPHQALRPRHELRRHRPRESRQRHRDDEGAAAEPVDDGGLPRLQHVPVHPERRQHRRSARAVRPQLEGLHLQHASSVHAHQENTVEESQVGYSVRHNSFMYYRSIVDNYKRCNGRDVPMTELWKDQKLGRVPH